MFMQFRNQFNKQEWIIVCHIETSAFLSAFLSLVDKKSDWFIEVSDIANITSIIIFKLIFFRASVTCLKIFCYLYIHFLLNFSFYDIMTREKCWESINLGQQKRYLIIMFRTIWTMSQMVLFLFSDKFL